MYDSACVCHPLARPKSGIAARLPQFPLSNPPIACDPRLSPRPPLHYSPITNHHSRISNRYTKLLEIELTRSQQTRKHFLIAIICPTFTPALQFADKDFRMTPFLFATNGIRKIVVLMKTKEKRVSIRYKFSNVAVFRAPASCRSFDASPGARVAGHGSRISDRVPQAATRRSRIASPVRRKLQFRQTPPKRVKSGAPEIR